MVKHKQYRFLNHFWVKESGLSGMLVLLFIMQFILIPLFSNYSFFRVVLNLFWMLFLMAGIFSLAATKRQAFRISIIPFLFIVFRWIDVFYPIPFVILAEILLTVCTFSLLIVLVFMKVFEPGPITVYRVIGSVVVYMLLANLWSVVYLFLYEHIEGSFQLSLPAFELNSLQANFLYFSYITITTTGFGEIVPLHPIARSLVQVEALTGVLYPVVLIGRLVSDVNTSNKEKK